MSYAGKLFLSVGIIIVGIVAIPILYINMINWFFDIQIETTAINVMRIYAIGIIMSVFGAGLRLVLKEIAEE
jgi:hypothetical protein